MAIIQDIKKFLGLSTIQNKAPSVLGVNKTFVGQFKPYIGADNKTRYIEDFEKVKYAYSVISWIAKKSAKVPFTLFNNKADGTRDIVKVNAFLKLIEKPNSYQTSFNFKYQAYGYLLTTGALYIYIPKLSSGRWTEMHVIPSDFVQPVYERAFEKPSGFIIKDSGMTISIDEMLFVFNDSLKYDEVGVGQDGHSPMQSLLTVLKKTEDIDKADLATIQNGGVSGIITDRTSLDPWNQEQAELVEQKMREKAYGTQNKGKFLVTSGDVSFIPLGLSPVDLNLYQANNQVLRDICIVYHIPYIIFDQTDASASFGSHMKEARKMAYTDAILPLVEAVIDAINHYGLQGFGKDLVLDYDTSLIEELQTDNKAIAETLSLQWWKDVATKQRESGMEVDPQFEGVYYLPANLVKLEDTDFNSTVTAIEEEFRALEKKFDL
jgi:HK97 family phage portal protein